MQTSLTCNANVARRLIRGSPHIVCYTGKVAKIARKQAGEEAPARNVDPVTECLRKESQLHAYHYRTNRPFLEKALAEDFCEITADGRVIDKSDVLRRLPQERLHELRLVALDMTARPVADAIIHITYELVKTAAGHEGPQRSARTSLWRQERTNWVMFFHQGTPLQ